MADSTRKAEELFAEYLACLQDGRHVDFDDWVATQGSNEEELRELFLSDRTLQDFVEAERSDSVHASPSFFRSTPPPQSSSTFLNEASAGDVIGDFRLLHLLGSGGMGQVWEAVQSSLNRRVALKLIRPGVARPQVLQMFAREARAGGRLSHPAIVSVYGFGQSEGVHWIAMELVPGGCTLREFIDRMREQTMLPRDYYPHVAELVAVIADALQAAHDACVIHRDVKPQNVLITSEDRPVLTDFGLARITDETALSHTGEFAGTYLYMSPEQVAANRMGIDHRTDVFSLGVVLYELLGLERPFSGDTTHQIAEKILTHDPPDLRLTRSRVPFELTVIAGKALEKRPGERYQSMAELAADLRRYLAHEPVHARPPGIWRRARRWVERHPTSSVAVTVLLLGLIATASTAVWALRNAREADYQRDRAYRLTAGNYLEELVLEARSDELWPAHPAQLEDYGDWMKRAEVVLAGLHPNAETGDPGHLALLDPFRARGEEVPSVTEGEIASGELERAHLARRLEALRRAQAVRDGEATVEPVEVEPPVPLPRFIHLCRAARALVAPDRIEFGREAEGLARANLALGLAEDERSSLIAFEVWCEACLANGLEEDALMELESFGLSLGDRWVMDLELFAAEFVPRAERALEFGQEEILALEQRIERLDARIRAEAEATVWRFAEVEDAWWHDHMQQLVLDLQAFGDPTTGELHGSSSNFGWGIERRRRWAEGLREAGLDGTQASERWALAIAAIADVEACPQYGGLRIEPQAGLAPIGRDPNSGLLEFAHLQTGAPAERDGDGHIVRTPEMGLVLVLVPGSDELAPYFLSKYELTQAQWERFSGSNPSQYSPGGPLDVGITGSNPVESVDWHACRRLVRRLGLELPSVARWRHAAGWSSEPIEVLADMAPEARSEANLLEPQLWNQERDGYETHAPVGSFPPTPTGFHDMRGNVSEWCADAEEPESAPDGEGAIADSERVYIGSGWFSSPLKQEIYLQSAPRTYSSPDLGLRPARSIVR